MAGITARMTQIQAQISRLSPPPSTGGAGAPAAAPSRTAAGPSFEAALSQAVTRTAPPSGRVNRDGVPVDLARYGNGKIPGDALSPLGQGRHTLWAPAAASFQQMSAAAAREGIKIKVSDSYRSYSDQVDVARRKGLYSQGGLAAKPGTSDHGWGLSLDLDLNGRELAWMRANAPKFGFGENVAREPWHWTYSPKS